MTCALNEVVADISFNDEQIVLLITQTKTPSKIRIEFRARNMSPIRHLMLNNNNTTLLLLLNNGYLLGDRQRQDCPWNFTFIDGELKQHGQKFLSSYGIMDIKVVKNSENESMLAIYRERECAKTLTYDRSKLVIDLYKI